MTLRTKFHQKGITFFGLLFVGSVLAMAGVVVAQIVPTVIELQAVQKAAARAATMESVVEIRQAFDKQASIDDIKSISGKDIEVTKEGDKVVVSFSYEREIHLVGPAFLTLKYSGRSK